MSRHTPTAATVAAARYAARVAELRSTMDSRTSAFATAMSEACAAYESAMVADIGARGAARLGAGFPRLGGR